MKKSLLLGISLLLCACTAMDNDRIDKNITSILAATVTDAKIAPADHSKSLYSYYVPIDVNVKGSNETGSILIKNGFDIVLNFNTSSLIINEYYTDLSEADDKKDVIFNHYTEESLKALEENDLLIPKDSALEKKENDSEVKNVDYQITKQEKKGIESYRGYYDSANHTGLSFQLNLKRVKDDYYLHLDGAVASLTSVVPAEEVDNTLKSMMIILKSIRYDKEKVLESFSLNYDLKTMEEKFKENENFIYQSLPSEGYLEDLINYGK